MDLGAFFADVYSFYLDKTQNKDTNKILKNFYADYEQYAEELSLRAYQHILENIEGDFEQDEKML